MRVFLDTNVLFSGLHSARGIPNRILEAASAGTMTCVVSLTVLQELARNIRRKAPGLAGEFSRFLANTRVEVLGDPSDDETQYWIDAELGSDAPLIAAALAAAVDYFCTGDKRLRARSAEIRGLTIVSPAELLDHLPSGPR